MKSIVFKSLSVTAASCALAASLQAADGVLIVERTTIGGKTETGQVQIEKGRMRADSIDGTGAAQTVLYDGAKQLVFLIHPATRTYNEMTKAELDRLGGQLQDALSQMDAQLATLPPAQRAQVQAMMKGRGLSGAPPKTQYRKTGTDRVGNWTCDKYEGYQNGQKQSEMCTVDPAALGLSAADLAVMQEVAGVFSQLSQQGGQSPIGAGRPEVDGFSGVPVRRVFSVAGREAITEVTEVTRQTFPDALFTVPEGYKKQAVPGGRH